ncbi:holin [Kitasatospora sp. NPDC057692]|uniref:holin n=1 Tax=Kitasatospora sp. NPDC057692 TaxID=3346215 RepID=UPI0036B765D8
MRKYIIDVAERTVATYVVALLGLLLADGVDLTSVGTLRAAAVAALPAALTVVKGAVAGVVGDPTTAALLPRTRE